MAETSHVAGRLYGSFESSIAKAHVSVTPAKTSPLPMNAGSSAKSGSTRSARIPPIAARAPAAIRTCRSSEIRERPRSTGNPDCSHAFTPPSRTCRFGIPLSFSAASARFAR